MFFLRNEVTTLIGNWHFIGTPGMLTQAYTISTELRLPHISSAALSVKHANHDHHRQLMIISFIFL